MGNRCREENGGEGRGARKRGRERGRKKKTEQEIFPERKGGRKGWLRWEREKKERRLEIEIDDIESDYDRDRPFILFSFLRKSQQPTLQ